jgi:hypothetical protein
MAAICGDYRVLWEHVGKPLWPADNGTTNCTLQFTKKKGCCQPFFSAQKNAF